MKKPQRRWCLARDGVPLLQHASLMGETFVEFLRRSCEWLGGSVASKGLVIAEIEVRIVTPKKRKARKKP